MNNNNEPQQGNQQRKKELKDKVEKLAKTVREMKSINNMEEAIASVRHLHYISNIRQLKKFLVDRDCKGEKPNLMVESPYANPETGITEDRIYVPLPSEYHQETLDMLKKQQLIPQDSTIEDYSFLFEFNDKL